MLLKIHYIKLYCIMLTCIKLHYIRSYYMSYYILSYIFLLCYNTIYIYTYIHKSITFPSIFCCVMICSCYVMLRNITSYYRSLPSMYSRPGRELSPSFTAPGAAHYYVYVYIYILHYNITKICKKPQPFHPQGFPG